MRVTFRSESRWFRRQIDGAARLALLAVGSESKLPVRYRPLQPGESSQVVAVTVLSNEASTVDMPLVTTTRNGGLRMDRLDPNPGDNTVTQTTELGVLRVAGGGLGCSTATGGSTGGALGLLATTLLALGLRLRRRFAARR